MRATYHCLAAIVFIGLAPVPAAAQPMDTYGIGSRSVAMGGAVTADVSDFSANYYNPAGLVRGEQVRLALGWFGVHHELQINGFDSNVDPVHGSVVGLVVPGNIEGFRFAFGLGIHLNDARISRTRSLPGRRPRWEFYDNRPHRTFLATHLAIRPFDWLMIGGGIAFLSYSRNTLSLRGNATVSPPELVEVNTRLENDVLADLTTIRYPQIGIQVMPVPELSLGIVYRGQFALDNVLLAEAGNPDTSMSDVILEVQLGGATVPVPSYFLIETASVNAFVPQQLSFAASWSPTADFTVNVELTWLNWSAYVSPIGSSRIDIVLDPSVAGIIRVPEVGGSQPVPANFQDRFVPRLGVEGVALRDPAIEVRVRGGGFYEHSPVPEQTGYSNLIDTDRLMLSAGTGLRFVGLQPLISGWLQFDAHLVYAYLPERFTRKSSPVDPVGDWRAGGHMVGGGVTMEIAFQ